jgi:hypothetical protein
MTTYSMPSDSMQKSPVLSAIFDPFLNSLRIVLRFFLQLSHVFSLRENTAVAQLPITRQNNVAVCNSDHANFFRMPKGHDSRKQRASMPCNLCVPLGKRNQNSATI